MRSAEVHIQSTRDQLCRDAPEQVQKYRLDPGKFHNSDESSKSYTPGDCSIVAAVKAMVKKVSDCKPEETLTLKEIPIPPKWRRESSDDILWQWLDETLVRRGMLRLFLFSVTC